MASKPEHPQVAERDGTSQAGRMLEALSTDYVAVDEQTSTQLLAFARAYSAELTYYDQTGTPRGTWSDFISSTLNLADVVDFLRDPAKFDAQGSPELFRPHFVLFLAFLKLLEKSRGNLNQLTQRHLDYYYRQILHMGNKPSIPDRVNLVVNLAPNGTSVLVPRGAQLNAGPDSSGLDRIYATDRDIIVNRAQISRLSSLFTDRRRTTLRQAPLRFPNDKQRATQAMLEIALGSPLPLYPDGTVVDIPKLFALRAMLQRAEVDYYLSLSELRDLMTRRSLRPAPPAEWNEINAKLEAAGRKKRGNTTFTIDRYSQDFYGNIALAVGPFDLTTLPQVNIVDDLADLRTDPTAAEFILTNLWFDSVDDFARMISLKRKFVNEWAQINAILELAGQRKRADDSYTLPIAVITDFATNVQTAIGLSLATLQSYWDGVVALENYFFMSAEHVVFASEEIITVAQDDWEQVFLLLENAHKEKRRRERKEALRALREGTPPGRLIDLMRLALGEPPADSEDATAFDRLVPYLGQADTDKLTQLDTDGNWERIYSLLELAQRNRQGEPLAESTEWLNLYPAEDATAVIPTRSMKLEDTTDTARFAAFGVATPISTPEPVPSPVIGWALSTPLLKLSEGERIITLTLGFDSTETPLAEIFVKEGELSVIVEISTAEGFVACQTSAPVFGAYATLCTGSDVYSPDGVQFVITLPDTFPAIAAPPDAQVDANDPWPVLRLLMRPLYSYAYAQHIARYPELSQLELLAVHVKAAVTGLRAIQLQNDETTLDPKRPMEPFGSTPLIGSRFLIGHPEIVAKRLDGLTFDFQWMGAPDNISTHYANYGFASGPTFTAKVSLIDGPRRVTLAESAALFGVTGSTPATITIGATPFTWARDMSPSPLAKDAAPLDEDLANWDRFVQWELNSPDFQHQNYSNVVTEKALALSIASASSGSASLNASLYQVKVPYTPKLKSISVGYTSSLEVKLYDLSRDTRTHRVLHIHPFGACAAETERTGRGVPFLPPYEMDGELYIGLSEVAAPQVVSIFIQVAEGSADSDLKPQPISWSYLDGDRWISLARHVLSDTTRGLCNSGVIELNLPAAQPSSRIRSDLYFIRATIARDTLGICDIVGVHTQGVAATFVDRGNAPDHFRVPLPAKTIKQLVNRIPLVSGITQPYTSYGGRMAEDPTIFNTRVSERLRHKGRALSIWDYERLILDRFPELHKVKCIPARPDAPGAVTIIVIPDIRNKTPFEPFEPKAPANLLGEITDYVTAKAPACADIEVKNAHYVSVRVRLGVRFRGTGNEAFYKQQLIEDLNRFLSPWAYDEGSDIAIGGRIYASTIVDFVDRRTYVDYVAGIKLFRSEDGQLFRPVARPPAGSQEGYFVETERPDAVLVAARSHLIDVLSDAVYEEKLITGIGFMKLELDFSVAEG